MIFVFCVALLSAFCAFLPNIQAPPRWLPWQKWGPCSETCGQGKRIRQRNCAVIDKKSKKNCVGSNFENGNCSVVDLCTGWGPWHSWSKCNATCGLGKKIRYKPCHVNFCDGDNFERRQCRNGTCPGEDYYNEDDEPGGKGMSKKTLYIIAGGISGVAFVLFLGAVLYFFVIRKKLKVEEQQLKVAISKHVSEIVRQQSMHGGFSGVKRLSICEGKLPNKKDSKHNPSVTSVKASKSIDTKKEKKREKKSKADKKGENTNSDEAQDNVERDVEAKGESKSKLKKPDKKPDKKQKPQDDDYSVSVNDDTDDSYA